MPNSAILSHAIFLNQVRGGYGRRAHGFLKLILCRSLVWVFVCQRLRLLITSGVMWRDVDLIQLVKQVLQLLYATVAAIVYGRGLGISARHRY